jgi:hypothetical protein
MARISQSKKLQVYTDGIVGLKPSASFEFKCVPPGSDIQIKQLLQLKRSSVFSIRVMRIPGFLKSQEELIDKI